MSVKFCPLLMQARASAFLQPSDRCQLSGVEYDDPTSAPGVACIGSTCAAWTTSLRSGEVVRDGWGRCAHFGGDSYPDPAGGTQ